MMQRTFVFETLRDQIERLGPTIMTGLASDELWPLVCRRSPADTPCKVATQGQIGAVTKSISSWELEFVESPNSHGRKAARRPPRSYSPTLGSASIIAFKSSL